MDTVKSSPEKSRAINAPYLGWLDQGDNTEIELSNRGYRGLSTW